jgi:hypothetical protein
LAVPVVKRRTLSSAGSPVERAVRTPVPSSTRP